MTRSAKLLGMINPLGLGLEIGPFHAPIAPKRDGYRVEILDILTQDQLIEVAKAQQLPTDRIEDVDFVWSGQPYRQLTLKPGHYDWVIASHVIEHMPDLITFLRSCEEVLTKDGVLALAIPDRRYCFDFFRPISGLAHVIDTYAARPRHSRGVTDRGCQHSLGTATEHFLNVVSMDGAIAWMAGSAGEMAFVHPFPKPLLAEFAAYPKVRDFHAWVFTPTSFRLLIHDLKTLGLTGLHEVAFYPTEGCEFFVGLSARGESPAVDRLSMLKQIRTENG